MQIDHRQIAHDVARILVNTREWVEFTGRLEESLKSYVKELHEEDVKRTNRKALEYQKKIETLLAEKDPNLLKSIDDDFKVLKKTLSDFANAEKAIEKKLKKLVDSSSLCEDVYRMRDEMKAFKKEFEAYSLKMKKVFA